MLAVVLVLTSVVSAGYYLPVVMATYMKPEPVEQAHAGMRLGAPAGVAVALAVFGLLFLGVRPNRLLDLAKTGGSVIRPAAAASSVAPPFPKPALPGTLPPGN